MDLRIKTPRDLENLELGLLAPGRALLIGAIGGALAVLFYKTSELFVRGVMDGSFQLSPSEKVATAILIIATGVLIYLVPSNWREIQRLRDQNDERLRGIAEDLERIERDRT